MSISMNKTMLKIGVDQKLSNTFSLFGYKSKLIGDSTFLLQYSYHKQCHKKS